MTTTVKRIQDGCDGADLVARCRRGDADAWPDFVRRFAPYFHAIAVRGYRLSEQDGEDVFQEVFLRAWTHIDSLRDDAAIRPWLGQLTRRLAIDGIRSRSREAARDDLETLHDVPSADELAGLDEALTVRHAIEQLPGIHRDIVDRFFIEGQSHATIAADLGIAEGTVASRIARARERLRPHLTTS
jgi:RNA polymerase sigma-70 factor, ECF subfamily